MQLPYQQTTNEEADLVAPEIALRTGWTKAEAFLGLFELRRWVMKRCPDDAPPSMYAYVEDEEPGALVAMAMGCPKDPDKLLRALTTCTPPVLEKRDGRYWLVDAARYNQSWLKNRTRAGPVREAWTKFLAEGGPVPKHSRSGSVADSAGKPPASEPVPTTLPHVAAPVPSGGPPDVRRTPSGLPPDIRSEPVPQTQTQTQTQEETLTAAALPVRTPAPARDLPAVRKVVSKNIRSARDVVVAKAEPMEQQHEIEAGEFWDFVTRERAKRQLPAETKPKRLAAWLDKALEHVDSDREALATSYVRYLDKRDFASHAWCIRVFMSDSVWPQGTAPSPSRRRL